MLRQRPKSKIKRSLFFTGCFQAAALKVLPQFLSTSPIHHPTICKSLHPNLGGSLASSMVCILSPLPRLALAGLLLVSFLAGVTSSSPDDILIANFGKKRFYFKFQKNPFRYTAQPKYAKGKHVKKQNSLAVFLGGVDNDVVWGMSGGWGRGFRTRAPSNIQVLFDYRVVLSPGVDDDAIVDVMMSIDGKAIGYQAGSDYLFRLRGKNGNKKQDTRFKFIAINVGRL